MEKVWQVRPKIDNDFIIKNPGFSRVVLQLLFNRGLKDKKEIEQFFNSSSGDFFDPFLFNNMATAVDLIIKHIKAEDKIVIYGDYDADGVTSTAILAQVLTILKAKIEIYIPDRASEGYGLNKKAIDEFIKNNLKLIITVDGGIRDKNEVEYAKASGLDIIITDHHVSPEEKDLPDCLIINPNVAGENYPFKNLAGAGVAAKLAEAIISRAKLPKEIKEKLREQTLDLAAIGTIADCVSLLGENRILVKEGLKVVNKNKRMGLGELIKVAQINGEIEEWNIGFQIAPRLNAAGRMEHANTAFELLTTKNKEEAETLSRRLNNRNIDRQRITEEIMGEIEKKIEVGADPVRKSTLSNGAREKIIIGVCPLREEKEAEVWNEGVIGLVAGKLSDKYYRPVLVITKGQEGYKGSGRSIPEFNIIAALEEAREFLEKYGGHPAACGFSLKEENLENFIDKMKKLAEGKLNKTDLRPKLEIEAELALEEIDEGLVKNLEKFSPFGQDNPRPKFISRKAQIKDIINMGIDGQHVKFRFNGLWAVAFGRSEEWKKFKIGDKVDVVYYIENNNFNGRSEVQLKLVDIKSHNA
ncbi:MAG: single-stranded-DNA-specific exonuclease RecJ [Patescibacteria group bacterium]|nr:single-stranded-DNA-specific exonuclease RecJ [Patescibacteria group bacterium]MDD5294421.1 single-stranded-DNA-specific exonuclease RecJ [Patescibacteria group bacterium]MDD5554532.1 single-stranded-DNA-specific exonuclease RecJ [Patescibacteria group bacterium]